MTAAKPGLNVGSTRPLSRAERRAAAARVHAENAGTPEPAAPAPEPAPASPPPPAAKAPARVELPVKQKTRKRPFSTQLRSETLARLEWTLKHHDAALTDIVDAALSAYLDAAGVPNPDDAGTMPQ